MPLFISPFFGDTITPAAPNHLNTLTGFVPCTRFACYPAISEESKPSDVGDWVSAHDDKPRPNIGQTVSGRSSINALNLLYRTKGPTLSAKMLEGQVGEWRGQGRYEAKEKGHPEGWP